jgi:hypothetical protein
LDGKGKEKKLGGSLDHTRHKEHAMITPALQMAATESAAIFFQPFLTQQKQ